MKKFWAAAIFSCGVLFVNPALAQRHQVELHGIMNAPDRHVAFLLVDGETVAAESGYGIEVGRAHAKVEFMDVDPTNEIVRLRIDSVDFTNSLPKPDRPATAQSWIHLDGVEFKTAMDLYGRLLGKTILIYPSCVHSQYSCEASWTSPDPSQSDYRDCFAKGFTHLNVSALDDGDRFVQVVPSEKAHDAVLGARDLMKAAEQTSTTNNSTDGEQMIAPGMIEFRGVDMSEVFNIYSKLINRQQKDGLPSFACCTGIYFTTTSPLTKPQVIYALETLLRWNGAQIVMNDDNTFSVTAISQPSK